VGVVIIEPTKRCAFILCVSSRAWVRGSRGRKLIERARDETADPNVSALVQQHQQHQWWLSFLILGNSGLEQWSGSLDPSSGTCVRIRVGDPCVYLGLHVHLRTARAGSHATENVHVASAIARIADWARPDAMRSGSITSRLSANIRTEPLELIERCSKKRVVLVLDLMR